MATDRHVDDTDTLLIPPGQPLIVLPFEVDGHEIERYFADEESTDAAVSEDDLQLAMDAIGAWSDLDWDELEGALEGNRRDMSPTPPIVP